MIKDNPVIHSAHTLAAFSLLRRRLTSCRIKFHFVAITNTLISFQLEAMNIVLDINDVKTLRKRQYFSLENKTFKVYYSQSKGYIISCKRKNIN